MVVAGRKTVKAKFAFGLHLLDRQLDYCGQQKRKRPYLVAPEKVRRH
jgi:hypothetical protein